MPPARPQQQQQQQRQRDRLDHLFDADLHYRPGMAPVVPAEGRHGQLIGSGDGTVTGPRIRGIIRWSFYEAVGDTLCTTNPGGRITTDDGATIWFDALGYALRTDPAAPTWQLAAALRFRATDRRYRWLEGVLGVWTGEFDPHAGHARYRAFTMTDARTDVPG